MSFKENFKTQVEHLSQKAESELENCFSEYNIEAAKAINIFLNIAKSIKDVNGTFFKADLLSACSIRLGQMIDTKFKTLRD